VDIFIIFLCPEHYGGTINTFRSIASMLNYLQKWVPGWHGEQWDFQNNEKTMEHSDHWIMTGWHGEQSIFKTMKRQWNILITGS
jgi:hypothetical protein